jgi:lysophospholipase L1-like esterase
MPDGIHLDAESHGILGKRLAQWVEEELIGS